MRFENPANGYAEEVSLAPLWCLLFGCIYFAVKGVWTHAVAALLLAFFTVGFSWLIYPFFATPIMETHYLRRGWIKVSEPVLYIENSTPRRGQWGWGRSILIAFLLVFSAISVASVWFARAERDAIRDEFRPTAPVNSAPINSPPTPRARPATNSQIK